MKRKLTANDYLSFFKTTDRPLSYNLIASVMEGSKESDLKMLKLLKLSGNVIGQTVYLSYIEIDY